MTVKGAPWGSLSSAVAHVTAVAKNKRPRTAPTAQASCHLQSRRCSPSQLLHAHFSPQGCLHLCPPMSHVYKLPWRKDSMCQRILFQYECPVGQSSWLWSLERPLVLAAVFVHLSGRWWLYVIFHREKREFSSSSGTIGTHCSLLHTYPRFPSARRVSCLPRTLLGDGGQFLPFEHDFTACISTFPQQPA